MFKRNPHIDYRDGVYSLWYGKEYEGWEPYAEIGLVRRAWYLVLTALVRRQQDWILKEDQKAYSRREKQP